MCAPSSPSIRHWPKLDFRRLKISPDLFTAGLLLIEDFGDRVFGREVLSGADQKNLWKRATDVLIELRQHRPAGGIKLPDGALITFPMSIPPP